MSVDPKLAIADGALGFWKAVPQVFSITKAQRSLPDRWDSDDSRRNEAAYRFSRILRVGTQSFKEMEIPHGCLKTLVAHVALNGPDVYPLFEKVA